MLEKIYNWMIILINWVSESLLSTDDTSGNSEVKIHKVQMKLNKKIFNIDTIKGKDFTLQKKQCVRLCFSHIIIFFY